MDTHTEGTKKKKVPNGILAEQGDQIVDLPEQQITPTTENSLPPSAPEPDEAREAADDYREPAADATEEHLWQSATDILLEPKPGEAQVAELSGAPQAVVPDERSSADDYTRDTTGQTSQGSLSHEYFSKSAEVDEEVETDLIQHFLGIPDYLVETISPFPILARIVNDFFCIEGWKMVEDARMRELERLLCRVKHVRLPAGADLQTELAILKAACRMGSQGGPVGYAEKVATARRLFRKLEASTENPVIYRRGGARTKGESGDYRAENIRVVLQNRLGKDQLTITQYLHHSENLSEETLAGLVVGEAPKKFFEAVQKTKSEIMLKLQGHEATPDEMTAGVSELVRKLFEAYQSNDRKFEKDTLKNAVAQFKQAHFSGESGATQANPLEDSLEKQDQGDRGDQVETHGLDEEAEESKEGSPDQATTSTEDKGGSKGLEKSGGKPRQALKAPSRFDKKKDELVLLLSDFTSEATAITDDAGLQALALKVLAHGYRLCSQLLSDEEFQKTIKELRANARG